MNASDLATEQVQPAPGDSTITRVLLRIGALRRLSYCCRAIAELEALPLPTLTDELLLATYRERRARLAGELGLVKEVLG